MKRTLFSKYFYTCVSIIMISMVFLGGVFMIFATQYFAEDKLGLLDKNAEQAVSFTTANWSKNQYQQVQSSVLQPLFSLIGTSTDADILLVSAQSGEVLLCSQGEACTHKAVAVPQSIIDGLIVDGIYRGKSNLGGFLPSKYYTVARPVYDSDGDMAGAVFACTSAAGLTKFLVDILQMFIISAAVVLLCSFVIIYFITSNLAKPLQDMLAATRSFSAGDFSVRVPVEGDDEVAMLSEAFNTMADSLTNMEQMHRSFTANVSHELKTPMTSISGFIDGILDGTIPPEQQNRYLRVVSEETKRLARLVRSMLSISRIEAGELEIKPEPVDITDIVVQTMFSFEQKVEDKHIDVSGLDGERRMVMADADMIHQVVYNLIDNAVKFVNDGGRLEFAFREDSSGRTLVHFRNTGVGISPEEIPRLFDRFYKSDKSRSLDKNGVGLGLYIVKTIVNLHNGEIYVKSEPGGITEFTIALPSAPKAKQQPLGFLRKPGRTARKSDKAEPDYIDAELLDGNEDREEKNDEQ